MARKRKGKGSGEPPPSEPRARALAAVDLDEHPDPGNRRARVRYVAALMASGRWKRGQTGAELADAWGVRLGRVEHDAADASLLLDMLGDREALVQRIMVRLEGLAFDEDQDTRDVVAACKLMLETAGVLGAQKGGRPLEPDENATDALRELLREPPGWLADMLAALGWMRIESQAG